MAPSTLGCVWSLNLKGGMPGLALEPSLLSAFASGGTSPGRVSSDRNAMPHVSDKAVLRTVGSELGIPARLLRRQAGDKRLDLDVQSRGQREFNALLFRCLSTPRKLNPWDWAIGRSFLDLQSYISWAAAVTDRYIISAAAPGRVAAYLLPFTRGGEDTEHCIAGIPGLRLLSATDGTVLLEHLPTGGKLEIVDSPPAATRRSRIADRLEFEVRAVREGGEGQALFRRSGMTESEKCAFEAFHRYSELLARLSVRTGLWWRRGAEITLCSEGINSSFGTLSWRELPGNESILQKLGSPLLCIPGSHIIEGVYPGNNPHLCLNDEKLEIDIRLEPRLGIGGSVVWGS